MGLNDLTIEKLITEINGYKEKMRTIHEEYGRASQDLQDRINVLGYTLNEHLKETKDQMATTPQRLLNLEAKYVTGEVSDNEYFSQRQEFKGLLAKNLQSIEEIKQMIDVLSHIETKPLSPGEFKQTYPENRIPTGVSWVGAGALAQAKPWSPSPTPPISPTPSIVSPTPSIASPVKPDVPESVVDAAPESSSPVPALPQNNGSTSPTPESTNAPSTPSAPLNALAAASAPANAPVQSAEIGSSNVVDESLSTGPAQDVAEDVADALVVKVVDDVPVMEVSGAVATVETSEIHPAVPGTDAIPSIPVPADVASPTLTTPSQFYKVVCPKCGADVPKPAKVWELKGGKSKKNVLIGLFQCQDCRVKFREALTREIL
jgi:hypothetical protein